MDPGRQELVRVLERCGWVVSRAAKELGITRQALYLRMKQHGIRSRLTAAKRRAIFSEAGKRGGIRRTEAMTPEERRTAGKRAINARWAKERKTA